MEDKFYMTIIPKLHPTKVFVCIIKDVEVGDKQFTENHGWCTVKYRHTLVRDKNGNGSLYSIMEDKNGKIIEIKHGIQAFWYDDFLGINRHTEIIGELIKSQYNKYNIGYYFFEKPKITQEQFDAAVYNKKIILYKTK